ncbi:MAG: S-layer homology domain-containing protein [Bryobacterales bacterium]|nr:S-layer homology domain-containing protein [Bryobacterales bacterium]
MPRFHGSLLGAVLAVSGLAQSPGLDEARSPQAQVFWVDPLAGDDANSGAARAEALASVREALARIPARQTLTHGFRIVLLPGVYTEDNFPVQWESRWGTRQAPVVVEALGGAGAVPAPAFRVSGCRYLSITGIHVAGALSASQCDHLLLRSVRTGTLSLGQSSHVRVEHSDISGDWGSAVMLSAIRHGHLQANRIHDAAGWCADASDGTDDVHLDGNEFERCGVGGFSVGQQAGSRLEWTSGPVYEYNSRLADAGPGPRPAAMQSPSPLSASPAALRFVYIPGGAAPAAQSVSVTAASSTGFTAAGSTSSGVAWLNVSPGQGLPPAAVNVSVSPGTLAANVYSGSVTFTVPGASPLLVPVALAVFTPGSATQVFNDVPVTHPWVDFIYLLGKFGVSIGCSAVPLMYCPGDNVTQAQMAAFVIRAMLGESFSYPATPFFADMAADSSLFKYVQKMRELNINPGCGSGQFCPNSLVTRGQMAQYLVRARFGDTFPYPAAARFSDAPSTDALFPYVQKLWDMGVTQGCTGSAYCPAQYVTREQMAAFLTRTFFNFGVLTPAPPPPPPPPPSPPPPPLPPPPTGAAPQIAGCNILPADNIWNTPIDTLPVHANSSAWVNTIGSNRGFHMDFGSGLWDGGPIGIPFAIVPQGQPRVTVSFDYADESDPGPYPIPANPPIEGGADSSGDRHVLILEQGACKLYELYYAFRQTNGTWTAGSGAIYDLTANGPLRPATWTSADAAGLPILPGLARYDEVAAGEIRHAIRFTAPQTKKEFVWPARHYASSLTGTQYPPMGARFRLKAAYDISGFSAQARVILRAMKKYGIILADNGASWFMSGVPDERWNNTVLHELDRVTGSNIEAVDESSLMIDVNSGQARQP